MCEMRAHGCAGTPRPKTLRYRFDTQVLFEEPAREHTLVLRCQPREGKGLRTLEGSVSIAPEVAFQKQRDSFGNALIVCRIVDPHDYVRYVSEGVVCIDLGKAHPCTAHPLYRYPSARARASAEMLEWLERNAMTSAQFCESETEVAFGRVRDLCHAISSEIAYMPGSTTTATSAAEAFSLRCGVCQDYAHIMVALLRHLGVAARYVQGLAVGEGCTHAWIQAHLGGRWQGFDPTRDACVDETYLPLAVGRDWLDCPVERGNFLGAPGQNQRVHMEVLELEDHA